MQNPAHKNAAVNYFKIDSVVVDPITVKNATVPFNSAKSIPVHLFQICRLDLEPSEEFELKAGIQLGNFRCADLVEDYLKHAWTLRTLNPLIQKFRKVMQVVGFELLGMI